jgi:predicted unusual protein kinase regulating ubiquinone biosynthesis (AarF/ABC1/UbiB family)
MCHAPQFYNADPSLKKKIAKVGVQAFLQMLFKASPSPSLSLLTSPQDNFVHGDLHPGNIYVRFENGLCCKVTVVLLAARLCVVLTFFMLLLGGSRLS